MVRRWSWLGPLVVALLAAGCAHTGQGRGSEEDEYEEGYGDEGGDD